MNLEEATLNDIHDELARRKTCHVLIAQTDAQTMGIWATGDTFHAIGILEYFAAALKRDDGSRRDRQADTAD